MVAHAQMLSPIRRRRRVAPPLREAASAVASLPNAMRYGGHAQSSTSSFMPSGGAAAARLPVALPRAAGDLDLGRAAAERVAGRGIATESRGGAATGAGAQERASVQLPSRGVCGRLGLHGEYITGVKLG